METVEVSGGGVDGSRREELGEPGGESKVSLRDSAGETSGDSSGREMGLGGVPIGVKDVVSAADVGVTGVVVVIVVVVVGVGGVGAIIFVGVVVTIVVDVVTVGVGGASVVRVKSSPNSLWSLLRLS